MGRDALTPEQLRILKEAENFGYTLSKEEQQAWEEYVKKFTK